MIDKFKAYDTTRVSAFLPAIPGATEGLKELIARLTTLRAVTGKAALQIAHLSNAARNMAISHALATRCQCGCETPGTPPSTVSSAVWETRKGLVVGAAAIGAGELSSVAANRLRTMATASIVMERLAAIGRIVKSLCAFEGATEALVAVANATEELVTAVGALAAGLPVASIAAAAKLIRDAAFLVSQNWTSVVRKIRNLMSTISSETLTMTGDLASSINLGLKSDSPDQPEPAGDATSRERARRGLRAFACATGTSVAAAVLLATPPSLRRLGASQLRNELEAGGLSARRAVPTAMLTAPSLVAPTMASISSDQATAEKSKAPMVFNSAPTIVINAWQPDDIESRVKDALEQHRETIYAQWSRELQRRQRTEF